MAPGPATHLPPAWPSCPCLAWQTFSNGPDRGGTTWGSPPFRCAVPQGAGGSPGCGTPAYLSEISCSLARGALAQLPCGTITYLWALGSVTQAPVHGQPAPEPVLGPMAMLLMRCLYAAHCHTPLPPPHVSLPHPLLLLPLAWRETKPGNKQGHSSPCPPSLLLGQRLGHLQEEGGQTFSYDHPSINH